MRTIILRRSEWVTMLAATLVATLIATMFAFTPAAQATNESQLEETPIAAVEGGHEDSGSKNTPQDEAPDASAVAEPHEETGQRDTQSAPTDDAPAPNTAQSIVTPMSHHGPVSLTVNPDPVDANGYALMGGTVELTGNCGTAPSFGQRRITVVDFYVGSGTRTVFSDFGSWSGPFTATDHIPENSRSSSSTLEYELYCNYGPSGPPHTVNKDVPVSRSTLTTHVTYPNDVPVTDLSILARNINTGFEVELSEESIGNNTFYSHSIFPGSYLIEYYSAGGDLLAARTAIVDGYDDWVVVDVTLSFPPRRTVSGTVTWADGSPVIDQQIVLGGAPTLEDPISGEVTRTDENGAYEFPEIPAGEYTVRVLHDDHGYVAWAPVTVEVGSDHVVDMELDLSAPGAIQGYATFSDGSPVVSDGSGIGNVELIGPVHRFVHTDDKGAYAFDGLPHGTYEVRVTGAYPLDIGDIDYTSDPIEVDVIPATTTSQDVVISMPTGSVAGGVFSDLDLVTPIPDVVVSIPALKVDDVTTDGDGRFHIDGVEGANTLFVIEVRTEDGVLLGSREWMLVTPGEHTDVPVYVTPPASLGMVNGTITWSNGIPADDAEVRLVPESGGTSLTAPVDSDGTYELIGVTAGSYTAQIIVDGEILLERTITVTSGGTTTEDFVLLLAGAIDGEARWSDLSGPVDGVEVEITDGAVVPNDTTGPLGQFEFDDLTPGMWHLTATYDSDVVASHIVTVTAGDVSSVTIDVPVPAVTPETGAVEAP